MIHKNKKFYKTKKNFLIRNSKSFQKKSNINDDVPTKEKIYRDIKNLTKENQRLFNKALQKHNFNSEVYIPHSLELKKFRHKNNKFLLYHLLMAENKIKDNDKLIFELSDQTNTITNNYKVANKHNHNNLKSILNSNNIKKYVKDNITLFKNNDPVNSPTILEKKDYNNDKELLSKFEKKYLLKKNITSLKSKILKSFNKNINLTNNFFLENLDTYNNNMNSNKSIYKIKNISFTKKKKKNFFPEYKEYIKELKNDINTTKKSIELLEASSKKLSKNELSSSYTDNCQLSPIKKLKKKKKNTIHKSYSGKYNIINTNFGDIEFKKTPSKFFQMLKKTQPVKKKKKLNQNNSLIQLKPDYNFNINFITEAAKTKQNFNHKFSSEIINESNFSPQKKSIILQNTISPLIDKYDLEYHKSKELNKLYKMIKKYEKEKGNPENSGLIEKEIKRYFTKFPTEITKLNELKKINNNKVKENSSLFI